MRARRALLYTPGNDRKKIETAINLEVDSICLDLEYRVPFGQKETARHMIVDALKNLDFGKSERLVRINPVRTDLAESDLVMVLNARPDGIVLPKVDSPERLHWVSRQISSIEEDHKWPLGSIKLLATIESAQAIINLPLICQGEERLTALILGAEDLSYDLGATRTLEGMEVFYARSAIVLHAAAFGLHAIDMIHYEVDSPESLEKESLQAVQMGFSGKQIIHPRQIDIVQEAFTPGDEEIKQAKKLLEEFTSQQEYNGAFTKDGKLIDMPVVKSTLRLLERARAAGKLA